MATGKKTGGRKKGTPNQLTSSARVAFRAAFDAIGGVDRLAEWAAENQTDFYRIYARLIPVDIHVEQTDSTASWREDDRAILDRLIAQRMANREPQKKDRKSFD